MKLLHFILILNIICLVSCKDEESSKHLIQSAYPIDSSEFRIATPPQFHDLMKGMSEEAVLTAIGEPTTKNPLWSLGEKGKVAGWRYAYLLKDEAGVVWIDINTDLNVTGIYWRNRDRIQIKDI